MFEGVIYTVTQFLAFYKWLIGSIQWRYFMYVDCQIMPRTVNIPVLCLVLEIKPLVPLNLIRLDLQFLKLQKQFRKLILKILFL